MVYVGLLAIGSALGLCVDNREYVAGSVRGGRAFGSAPFQRRQARNRVAIAGIYCLLTGVSACRIAVGNDYWVYRDNFNLIAQERHVSSEFGFNYIVKWLQLLFGYDNYLPIFAFFSVITVFFFIKALSDQGSRFGFSLYLLLAGGYYFNSLNSVRYYLALAVALFSMKYVLRGEYGKFVLWVLAGAMFHKSVLLVVPVYFAARFLAAVRLKKWHCIAGGTLVLSLIFGQSFYREIIFYFYPYYRGSTFDNGQLSYANILKCAGVAGLGLVCLLTGSRSRISGTEQGGARGGLGEEPAAVFRERELARRFYSFLNLAGLVVYCCGSFIPEVSRVGYYMIISQIFLIPELLDGMPPGWLRRFCGIAAAGAFGIYFLLLLKGMYALDVRLLPYLNWIFN